MVENTGDFFNRLGATMGPAGMLYTSDLVARLHVLVEAYDYCRELDRDVWDFAVEIETLRAAGFSDSDLRWLICRDFVVHGGETTFTGERRRSFRRMNGLKFFEQSCFVLTESGREFAGRQRVIDEIDPGHRRTAERHVLEMATTPRWDSERHELRVGNVVVKHFKLPAPNQEAILMAFQEEAWAKRIDDPIPPEDNQDPKQRLRDTIKSLNRNQKHRLISFNGDGSGQGVLWEVIYRPDLDDK